MVGFRDGNLDGCPVGKPKGCIVGTEKGCMEGIFPVG